MKRLELLKNLELIRPSVSDSDLVPIFTHYILDENKTYGYNDSIAIISNAHDWGDSLALHGKTLLELLKSISTDEVVFSINEDEVKIKAGKGVYDLPWLPKDDFLFEEPKLVSPCTIEGGADLIEGIETCLITASKDQTAAAIMGVTFNFQKTGLTLYSCDGDAITRYTVDGASKGTGSLMVPTPFCSALVKAAKETGTEKFKLSVNEDWACAQLPNWKLSIYGRMKPIDEPLDHAKLIKDSMKGIQSPVQIPLGLSEALGRASIVAESTSATTKVICDGNGAVQLLTQSATGKIEDRLTFRNHGEFSVHIHSSLVHRCLGVSQNIAFGHNCTVYSKGEKILVVCSNVSDPA